MLLYTVESLRQTAEEGLAIKEDIFTLFDGMWLIKTWRLSNPRVEGDFINACLRRKEVPGGMLYVFAKLQILPVTPCNFSLAHA